MSGLEYTTLGMVLPVFINIKNHVEASLAADADFELIDMSKFIRAVKEKLVEYDDKIQLRHVQVASVLDPRVKKYVSKMGYNMTSISMYIQQEYSDHYEVL